MSMIVHSIYGSATVVCDDCLCQNGAWLIPCHGGATCDSPIGYSIGKKPPNNKLPALRYRTFDSLVQLGRASAENNFDIDVVFENYIKL